MDISHHTFFLAGFIETWGRGIWRVDNAFRDAGLILTTFEESCGGVTVLIPRARKKVTTQV